jgi:hypothetical protein
VGILCSTTAKVVEFGGLGMLRYRSIIGVAAVSANSGGPFVTAVGAR